MIPAEPLISSREMRRQGLTCHVTAPLPLSQTYSEEIIQKTLPLSPGIPAEQQRCAVPGYYQRPRSPVAPGCGKVSAGAGCAFGFVFPPRCPVAAMGVSLQERQRAWRLLSIKFGLILLLYERISPKKQRER